MAQGLSYVRTLSAVMLASSLTVACNSTYHTQSNSQASTTSIESQQSSGYSAMKRVHKRVPELAILKRYDARLYDQIITDVLDAEQYGASDTKIINTVSVQTNDFINSRLPYASDQAIIDYTQHTLVTISKLYAYGEEFCHSHLFPSANSSVEPRKYLTDAQSRYRVQVFDAVIRTSKTAKKIPTSYDVQPYAKPIFSKLYDKYGNNMAVLDNPESPTTDKAMVCNVVKDLYRQILKLPPQQAALVLRWMYGQEG